MTVYIPTRDRIANLRKIIPRWLEQNIPVVLVVEKSELLEHVNLIRSERSWRDVSVISPKREERGIGYARRFAVNHAHRAGLSSIIMSDDDLRPVADPSIHMLLGEARKSDVLGIGAVRSLHDRFTNGAVSANHGPMLCPGGWGMQIFGLNVQNAIDVGNFDQQLDCFGEDHELMRNGIAVAGIPWLVHCDVRCEPIGVRYDPGGLNSFIESRDDGTRAAREIACRRILYARWPKYVSTPESRPRMRWQKMLDDYIPDWRARSAMHGGKWG
jgi:hypothetical protein